MLRVPVSLRVSVESAYYKDVIQPKRDEYILSTFIVDLLHDRYTSADVLEALVDEAESNTIRIPVSLLFDETSDFATKFIIPLQKTHDLASLVVNLIKIYHRSLSHSHLLSESPHGGE
jgi:hypothetical protein